jgi:hypothetical protein
VDLVSLRERSSEILHAEKRSKKRERQIKVPILFEGAVSYVLKVKPDPKPGKKEPKS